jgi:cell division transport system ATP-binding protein
VETPPEKIREDVPKILSTVGLAEKSHCFPKQLSGGEQQRVALARTLVNKPSIILADEPTGNLDPKNSREIMKLLEEINESGTTVVVVTHDKEMVNMMQKRVIAMQKGVVVRDEQNAGYDDES